MRQLVDRVVVVALCSLPDGLDVELRAKRTAAPAVCVLPGLRAASGGGGWDHTIGRPHVSSASMFEHYSNVALSWDCSNLSQSRFLRRFLLQHALELTLRPFKCTTCIWWDARKTMCTTCIWWYARKIMCTTCIWWDARKAMCTTSFCATDSAT